MMVLFLLFFATVAGVVVITVDPGDPDVMNQRPRDPKIPITNATAIFFWILYATALFLAALVPLVWGPDSLSVDRRSASMTMTFVVMGLGTVFNALNQSPRPDQWADAHQFSGVGDLTRAGHHDRPGDPVAGSAGRAAHHIADRNTVARMPGAGVGAPAGGRGQQMDPPRSRTIGRCGRYAGGGHSGTCPHHSKPTSKHRRHRMTDPRESGA